MARRHQVTKLIRRRLQDLPGQRRTRTRVSTAKVTAGSWRGEVTVLEGVESLAEDIPARSCTHVIRRRRPVGTQRLEAVLDHSCRHVGDGLAWAAVPDLNLSAHLWDIGSVVVAWPTLTTLWLQRAWCREALPIQMRSEAGGDNLRHRQVKRLLRGRHGDRLANEGQSNANHTPTRSGKPCDSLHTTGNTIRVANGG